MMMNSFSTLLHLFYIHQYMKQTHIPLLLKTADALVCSGTLQASSSIFKHLGYSYLLYMALQ